MRLKTARAQVLAFRFHNCRAWWVVYLAPAPIRIPEILHLYGTVY